MPFRDAVGIARVVEERQFWDQRTPCQPVPTVLVPLSEPVADDHSDQVIEGPLRRSGLPGMRPDFLLRDLLRLAEPPSHALEVGQELRVCVLHDEVDRALKYAHILSSHCARLVSRSKTALIPPGGLGRMRAVRAVAAATAAAGLEGEAGLLVSEWGSALCRPALPPPPSPLTISGPSPSPSHSFPPPPPSLPSSSRASSSPLSRVIEPTSPPP
eukprot:CAMPEP_0114513066 /NCGR_PEP_ID=MMETSP0109-20121206/15343_2 /TAXON_ID=29199 /ORGANISM="Chlorarachnion reptans, Strain CCCM449" /LENGTH=213 /DNA_ID=CAMNT_0001692857 /DNA_START=522 /DNA_END=1160 /DNA_ORIENTATION=-